MKLLPLDPVAGADLRRLYENPDRIATLAARAGAQALDLAALVLRTGRVALRLRGEPSTRTLGTPPVGIAAGDIDELVAPAARGEVALVPLRVPLLPSGKGASRVFGVLAAAIGPERPDGLPRPGPERDDVLAALGAQASALLVGEALARAGDHDRHTGLLTRAAFERGLATQGLAPAGAALILFDLDGLRAINDVHGQRAGDEVLELLAALVRAETGGTGLAARWGGDEVALLVPGLDERGARALAGRVQAGLAQCELGPPSASAGIALAAGPGELLDLPARADRALLAAKAEGRGRAVVHSVSLRAAAHGDRLAGVLTGDPARDHRNVAGLLDTIRAVSRLAPLDETLTEALDRSIALSGAERGLILVRDPQAGWQVRLARAAGGKPIAASAAPGARLELATSVADAALAEGRAVFRMAKQGEQISESAEALGVTAVLCAPLGGEDVAPGAVYLDARATVARFDRPTLAFFDALVAEVTTALRNARLYERLLERTRRLEADVAGRENELASVRRLWARDRSALTGASRGYQGIVGASPRMAEVFALLQSLEGSTAPVLVEGESGTGKELVARALHARSPRREGPFVSESCAAITESVFERELFGHTRGAFTGAHADRPGLLEAAHGGTLFLDEIGELALAAQAKLLRALQEGEVRRIGDTRARPVDVRILCATNRDLRAEVGAGRFREDLYYRLAVVRVTLPPLRERPTDVPLLVEHILADLALRSGSSGVAASGISTAALGALLKRRFRGNVRELRNLLERAAILAHGGVIEPSHLEPEAAEDARAPGSEPDLFTLSLADAKAAFASLYARRVLDREGSIAAAARRAGASRQTFYRLLEGEKDDAPTP